MDESASDTSEDTMKHVSPTLKSLKIARGQQKRALTNMEKCINAAEIDTVALKIRKRGLENIFNNFQKVQHEILCIDELDDYSDEFELRYYSLLTKIERLLKENEIAFIHEPDHSTSSSTSRLLKLPRIEIATFDGKLEDYTPFRDLFDSLIHLDAKLSNVQKLYYLKQYLKGEPLDIINNLPLTNESYISALELLKKRYDNPSILITKHINVILDLPILHRGSAEQLRALAVKVRQQMMALQNLKQPVNQWDSILFCVICRKLDTLTLRLYHSETSSNELPNVTALLDFIDKRACSLEASPSSTTTKNRVVVNIANEEKKLQRCIMCFKDHKLYKCPNFILMSPQKRLEFTNSKKLCKICLTSHEKPCRYTFKCSICSQDHNALIHLDKESISRSDQVLHTVRSSEHSVLLPTAKVLVTDAHNNKFMVRALLDSGSQTSFCTNALASKLGIPMFEKEKNIVTLGDNTKKVTKGINLQLHSTTENFNVDVICSIVDKITVSLPQKSFDISKFVIPPFVKLADKNFNVSGEISLLLAADVFFRVLKDGKVEGDLNEPVLINTHFGYIVSGNVLSSNNFSVSMHLKEIDLDQDLTVKTLGISLDIKKDAFVLSGKVVSTPEVFTKRSVLSSISKFFDPMGYAGPVVVKAKMILQLIWKHKLDWDTPLPSELHNIWEDFHASISSMDKIIISRDLHLHEAEEVELLGFCDASSDAYGCCLYLKVRTADNNFYVSLICAKSRIVGLDSKLTIPKLELNGALLLSRLASTVLTVLNVEKVFLFCDSKISLGWINTVEEKLPPYIANRVKEINKLTNNMTWKFTPGLLNPADILSRGGDPKDIKHNSLWWHGPDYIKNSCYNFQLLDIEYPLPVMEQVAQISNASSEENMMPFFTKISSITKMQRIMSYVFRFISKCKRISTNTGCITVLELQDSLKVIIRYVQHYCFSKEIECIQKGIDYKTSISCYLKMLHPFVDDKGLLRVGGRLQNSNIPFTQKFPIILPKKCHVTRLVILNEHLVLLHGGLKMVSSSLSQRFYILNSIREIKSIIHKCVTCTRFKAESAKQLMGSLPKERVLQARAFEKVGIDYCGPFEIKNSTLRRRSILSKAYVSVFICFTSKAIHLEAVSDMTSDAFISALKRFISRRGLPSDIYCDNAQTFKGADKQIKELYHLHNNNQFQKTITDYAVTKGIQFHYLPAYSPHQGGIWEAAVKSFKFHFKRVMGAKLFTFEQLITLATEIEAILNSRPICPMSNDSSDFSILTPGHFLIGCPLTSFPQPSLLNVPNNRLRFWRFIEHCRQHFWRAWSRDYLGSLTKRTKWQNVQPNIKIGDLVLFKENVVHPQYWPVGRVVRTFPGKDFKVRVIEVRTSDGRLHSRAFSKVVVLPTDE